MKPTGKAGRIGMLVWVLTSLGLVMGLVLLALVGWTLAQLRTDRLRANFERDRLSLAAQTLREQATRCHRDIEAVLNESAPWLETSDTISNFQSLVKAQFRLQTDPVVLASLAPLAEEIARLDGLARQATEWRAAYAPLWDDFSSEHTLAEVRGIIARIRGLVGSLEGRRRLAEAVKYRQWREAGSDAAVALAGDIIRDLSQQHSRMFSDLKGDLAEVARLVELLGREEKLDALADLQDNKFKSAFDRLKQTALELEPVSEESQEALADAVERLGSSLCGEGYVNDEAHQTIKLGQGGLFNLRRELLLLRQERVSLGSQLTATFARLEQAGSTFAESAGDRVAELSHELESGLAVRWRQIMFFGCVASLLFLWLAWLISREVRAQVAALHQAHADAEANRKMAEELTLATQTAAAELAAAHQGLQSSEQRFRSLSTAAPIGIFETDAAGKCLYTNPCWQAIAGRSSEASLGDDWQQAIHPEDRQAVLDAWQDSTTSDREFEREYRYQQPDGTVRWVQVRSSAILSPDGVVNGRVGTVADITERREAEESLRLREAALRAAANVVVITDRHGVIVWTNPAFTRETGYTAEEAMGQNPRVLKGGNHPPEFYQELWQTITSGQVWHGEFHNRRKDGSPTVEDATITPVRNQAGEITHFIAVKQNISERKQAEAALRRSEAALREAHRLAKLGNWEWNLVTDEHVWSPEIYATYGREAALGPASLEEVPQYFTPESWARLSAAVNAALAEGTAYECDAEVVRPDGACRWITARGACQRDADGKVVGLHGTIQDITERKQAEEALQQRLRLQDQLVHLAATVPGMIYSFEMRPDGSFRMPYASGALERLFHLNPDEVAHDATSVFALIHPQDLAHVTESVVESARTLRPWRDEFRVCPSAHEELWVEGNSVPQREPDGSVLWHGFLHDITRRKREQEIERQKKETKIRHQTALLKLTAQPKKFFAGALKEILKTDARTLGVGRVSYWTLAPQATLIRCEALFVSQEGRWEQGVELHRKDFPGYFAALESNPFIAAREAQTDARTAEFADSYLRPLRIASMLDVPVWMQGVLVGVVCHEHLGECREWTAEEQDFALSIGRMVSLALGERDLAQAHKELVDASRQAGMAEVATGVLHNVGNVLNSVNVASSCVGGILKKSKGANLGRVVALLKEHEADLGHYLTADPKGSQIPGYLKQLSEHLATERHEALEELSALQEHIDHIKDVVSMQQSLARVSGVVETVQTTDLVEHALQMNASSLARHDIQVIKEFDPVPPVMVDKHKVLQILINLVRNAKQACDATNRDDKRMVLRVRNGEGRVRIAVADNGVGIPPENLNRVFNHGFTTKKDGHGFGLHSGALAAREMGGTLTVHSEGEGRGAAFTLELPLQPPGGLL